MSALLYQLIEMGGGVGMTFSRKLGQLAKSHTDILPEMWAFKYLLKRKEKERKGEGGGRKEERKKMKRNLTIDQTIGWDG